jgi:hypothetical protein
LQIASPFRQLLGNFNQRLGDRVPGGDSLVEVERPDGLRASPEMQPPLSRTVAMDARYPVLIAVAFAALVPEQEIM